MSGRCERNVKHYAVLLALTVSKEQNTIIITKQIGWAIVNGASRSWSCLELNLATVCIIHRTCAK